MQADINVFVLQSYSTIAMAYFRTLAKMLAAYGSQREIGLVDHRNN